MSTSTSFARIEFEIPAIHRVWDVMRAAMLCLLFALLLSVLAVAILSALTGVSAAVGLAVVLGTIALGFLLAFAVCRGRVGRVVRLGEWGVERGPGLLRRSVAYGRVRSIQLQRYGQRADSCRICLMIGSGQFSFWLGEEQSLACFNELRRRCRQAPAVDERGVDLPAEDSDLPREAQRELVRMWRGRAALFFFIALLCPTLFTFFAVMCILLCLPNAPLWVVVTAVLCLGLLGALLQLLRGIKCLRRASEAGRSEPER